MFNAISCADSYPNLLGIFDTSIAPHLLYYSYIPTIIILLSLAFFVNSQVTTYKTPKRLFIFFAITSSLFLFNEIIQWIATPVNFVMFSWQLILLFYMMITTSLLLFNITYIFNKINILILFFAFLVNLPILVLLPTSLNIKSFDIVNCHGETGLLHYYAFTFMVLTMVFFFILALRQRKELEHVLLLIGSILAIGTIWFADVISEDFQFFEFNLFGSFGILLLACIIYFLISQFKAFNLKMPLTNLLVFAISALILSTLFFVENNINMVLIIATGILSTIGGLLLIKSVKREVKQREEIEKLVIGLEKANYRLLILDKQKSEFVSIASHQLRSPLTAIRGYISMLTEGSFGEMPEKASDVLQRINESSKFMASSIDDFLDVSRIESGNMKYDYSDVNFKEQAEHVVDDLRTDALKRGLLLMFRSNMDGNGLVHADAGKTQQILHNLINNALKYTPHGSVTVYAHDDIRHKKIHVDIIDTGLGLSPESMQKLFGKFARAKIASSANIMGTGLGLFVAREMCRAMGGDITATSEGEGLGSTFTITLPLL